MDNLINKFRNDNMEASDLKRLREESSSLSSSELGEILQTDWLRNDIIDSKPDPEIKEKILENLKSDTRFRRNFKLKVLGWTAAACVIIAATFITLFIRYQHSFETTPLNFTTAKNENATVVLPDNSVIKLNQNSDLVYNPHIFKKDNREINFTGEGYFKIHHDSNNPFTIQTENLLITVKGTEFNLCSKPDSQITSLYLVEGKVEMYSSLTKKSIDVHPGQLIEYNSATGEFNLAEVSGCNNIASWYTKEIRFDNEALPKVISFLENHYEVSAEVTILSEEINNKGLNNLYFNGTLPTGNLPLAIKAIEKVYPIKIKYSEASGN